MTFEYNELMGYVQEDFEMFYQMGFKEEQILPAILNEYEHGIGFSITENILIHLFTALSYQRQLLNCTFIINRLNDLVNSSADIQNQLVDELGEYYSIYRDTFNSIGGNVVNFRG